MSIRLQIERAGLDHSGRGWALLDAQAMEREQLQENDVVELRGRFSRSTLARVGPPLAPEQRGIISLDQYLRQGLKVHVGETVDVRKVEVGPVSKVLLAPMVDVSQISGLPSYLAQTFGARRLPVAVNSVLYASFPGASLGWAMASGSAFRVLEVAPGPGVMTPQTVVELKYIPPGTEEGGVTFEDVGGLGREIQLVRELVEIPLRFPETYRRLGINPPRGIVFYGPPGVGKTHLAQAIANEIEAKFWYINGPEVIGSTYGETEANLRKLFQEAAAQVPSIIFVDELDVIGFKRGESGAHADTRMATQFLALLDGIKSVEGIMVIGTTNRIEAVDMSFRRPGRFDRELYFGPPEGEGRLEILRIHTRGMPLSPEAEGYLEEIARVTLGFVGADLMELCREAGLNSLRRQLLREGGDRDLREMQVSLEDLVVEKQDFEQALTKLRPSALRESLLTVADISWENIGGLGPAKERMRQVLEQPLLHPELFAAMKLRPPKGVLLYGPPGTGKTLLVRAIAKECRVNFISVRGSEVFSQWVGRSEEQISHIFRVARQVAPSIVFFDQMDSIAPARSPDVGGTRVAERVVNQLLTEIDSIEPLSGVMIVGATNRIDLIDPAILTPSRLGVHLYIPLPDEETRKEILGIHLRSIPLEAHLDVEGILETLACRTEGYSGAELEAICQEAKMVALSSTNFQRAIPLTEEHLHQALHNIIRSRLAYTSTTALEGAERD
ncbi:MAG: AAA family ATPase [Chloroflexi bacterium]|nr:AAA family ATPase [Chloroflexota bacterium]